MAKQTRSNCEDEETADCRDKNPKRENGLDWGRRTRLSLKGGQLEVPLRQGRVIFLVGPYFRSVEMRRLPKAQLPEVRLLGVYIRQGS